eukprot:m.13144 g.13144  ORF g.13144 m.13144 type:complete len:65 (+) comp9607_c0_seq1:2973-3167(+)
MLGTQTPTNYKPINKETGCSDKKEQTNAHTNKLTNLSTTNKQTSSKQTQTHAHTTKNAKQNLVF